MSIKPKLGLRGKLSILILLIVTALSAVLTFYTSSYLADAINSEYRHRAELVASFIEASLINYNGPSFADHVQSEVDNIIKTNTEIKKISIYSTPGITGPSDTNGNSLSTVEVIASSDRASVGKIADPSHIEPIRSNQTIFAEWEEGNDGLEGGAGSGASQENGTVEMLAPLRTAEGNVIASVGVYLDTAPRDGLIRTQQIRYAIITNLGLLGLLLALCFSLNRMMISPIKKLTQATRQFGFSTWREPLEVNRKDEFGDLSRAFNELAESLDSRDEEVKLLLEASVAVSSALHVDTILQILCDKIADSQKVTYCRISILDPNTNSLIVKASSPTRDMDNWQHGVGESLDLKHARHHADVIKSCLPTVLRKNGQLTVEGSEEEWEWVLTPDTRSALLLPLISKDEAIGVVTLGEVRRWTRTPFSAKKIEFYQTLMNQAAVAIENAQLFERSERHVRELSAMHNISQAFTSTLDYQEVVSVVAQRVGNLIGAQFASVMLPDDEGRHLSIVASYNLSAEYVWTINRKRRIPIGFGPVGLAYTEGKSFAVNNVLSDESYEPWKHLASVQGYSSMIALPLLAKGQSIGVICIYFNEPRYLKDHEMNLLTTAANEAAIAIENARIYENLQDAFVGTIRSLAETIDAKDTYTRGHSERVSLYAEAIARGLGLDGTELHTIRYAGYLHDVGKIGIPDAILSKPGKLTVDEFRVIQTHPVISEKILKPVNFPFPVQSIVRHHHERYDGKGYPDSLAGEEIPLGARILFVADAFEAMTSDRPYRKALTRQMALDELERNKVTQFDPRVVEVFTRIIRSENTIRREAGQSA
ncbi:MAG: GAF domain-containing protein [Actinobacteria bacterium]|nr:GAF domain-containing protein [Actinomycetota bacterium]